MSRSLSYLRRGLLGIAFVGSLGFGATQALASPDATARFLTCQPTGYRYRPIGDECNACEGRGYCDGVGTECVCID